MSDPSRGVGALVETVVLWSAYIVLTFNLIDFSLAHFSCRTTRGGGPRSVKVKINLR